MLALQNKAITEDNKVEVIDKEEEEKTINTTYEEKKTDEENVQPKENDPWRLELFELKNDNQQKESESKPVKIPRDVQNYKLQRSLSQPAPLSQLNKQRKTCTLTPNIKPCYDTSNDGNLASDVYIYSLPWACCVMIFWKNISLLPLLPLPILIYIFKHIGFYLGVWQWLGSQILSVINCIGDWCNERYDAFVPAPARGLYRAVIKINGVIKDNVKDSIDTVSSIVVILGLIIFVTCASVFFAIQVCFRHIFYYFFKSEIQRINICFLQCKVLNNRALANKNSQLNFAIEDNLTVTAKLNLTNILFVLLACFFIKLVYILLQTPLLFTN